MKESVRREAMRLVERWTAGNFCDEDEAPLMAVMALDKALTDAQSDSAALEDAENEAYEANRMLEKTQGRLDELCDPSHRGMVQKIVTDLFTHGGVACKLFREDGSEVDSYDVERSLKELFTSEGVYDGCP